MTVKLLKSAGWIVVVVLVCLALVVDQQYQRVLLRSAGVGFSTYVAFVLAAESMASRRELMKNAVVASVVLAGVVFLYHGQPSMDEDGRSEDGFETTFEQSSGAAVKSFNYFVLTFVVGVWLAEIARRRQGAPPVALNLQAIEARIGRAAHALKLNVDTAAGATTTISLPASGEIMAVIADAAELTAEVKRLRSATR